MDTVATSAGYILNILSSVPGLNPIDLLALLKHELPCNGSPKGKEESLAGIGQLITVLCLMQTEYFDQPSSDLIQVVYPILIPNLKGREYLTSMCADIMGSSFAAVRTEIN